MSVYCIDFETFYDKEYSIKEMSTYRYMHDPRFDAYLVAVYSDDYQYLGPPKAFDWSLLEGSTVLMHNAVFDHSVVLRLQELGIVHKSLRYKMFDTADMAAFLRAPRHLKGAAKQLLGVDMDKSVRDYMKGKTFETLSPDDVEKVRQYGLTDARLTYELWKKYHDQWPAEEQELSRLNREAQLYGVQLDMGKVEAGVQSLQNQVFEAERAIPWIDEFPPLSPKAVRIQGRKDGIPVPASLAKTDEAAIAWENEYGERYPWIAAIKNYRSINTVYKKMLNLRDGATENGVFQYAKKYYGAVTGRFSGGSDSGGKVNVENLSREDMFGVDMRGMFVARPGHSFIISDYAQVEPRLLLWRVGDTTMLDAIRNGLGIYDAHARMYMGYTKAAKLKEGDNRLYRLSKARCLSADTLVLTKTGYRPIIQIRDSDMVWDGGQWVHHDGVKQTGTAITIGLEGDRFTKDHLVYANEQQTITAGSIQEGESSAYLFRRDVSPAGWNHVWFLAAAVARVYSEIWYAALKMRLRNLRKRVRRQ